MLKNIKTYVAVFPVFHEVQTRRNPLTKQYRKHQKCKNEEQITTILVRNTLQSNGESAPPSQELLPLTHSERKIINRDQGRIVIVMEIIGDNSCFDFCQTQERKWIYR